MPQVQRDGDRCLRQMFYHGVFQKRVKVDGLLDGAHLIRKGRTGTRRNSWLTGQELLLHELAGLARQESSRTYKGTAWFEGTT